MTKNSIEWKVSKLYFLEKRKILDTDTEGEKIFSGGTKEWKLLKPPEVGFLQAELSGLADEAEVVVHQGADGEDVGRVDASADDFQTDFVVLDLKKTREIWIGEKRNGNICLKKYSSNSHWRDKALLDLDKNQNQDLNRPRISAFSKFG